MEKWVESNEEDIIDHDVRYLIYFLSNNLFRTLLYFTIILSLYLSPVSRIYHSLFLLAFLDVNVSEEDRFCRVQASLIQVGSYQ